MTRRPDYEAGESPNAWQRCRQCNQPLCDQCVTDDEHECPDHEAAR